MIFAAGLLILAKSGNALFLRRSMAGDYAGTWCLPGGRIEKGETADQAALRECLEETGLQPAGKLKYWTRRIAPTPAGDEVDFTTFLLQVEQESIPTLNDEHIGWQWAPINQPPDPLHPGVHVALERFQWTTELAFAEAIRDGKLTSPQDYGNITLVALRVSGTGVAHRNEKKSPEGKTIQEEEIVYRRPENYLSAEFLARCNGLPVVMLHPNEAILNSEEFARRIMGALFLPYIKGNEVWAIARIYDRAAARMLTEKQLSTSPGVLLGKDSFTIRTEDGEKVLIEGKPSLLDHLAICEHGVWDKGGEPSGVETTAKGDSAMIKLARLDGETDERYKARCDEAEAIFAGRLRADSTDGVSLAALSAGMQAMTKSLEEIGGSILAIQNARKDDAKRRHDAFKFSRRHDDDDDDTYRKRHDDEEKECADAAVEGGMEPEEAKKDAAKRRRDAEEAEKEELETKDDDAKRADARRRVDAFKFSSKHDDDDDDAHRKKGDAEEGELSKMLEEAGEPKHIAADKAKRARKRHDDDDDARRHDSDTKRENEALKTRLAALEGKLKTILDKDQSGGDKAELIRVQARADSVLSLDGKQAPAAMLGEAVLDYRMRMLRMVLPHSKTWEKADIEKIAIDEANFTRVEDQVYDEAAAILKNPINVPAGQLVMRTKHDGGHEINEFHGEAASWMRRFAGPVGKKAKGDWKIGNHNGSRNVN